MPRQHAGFGGIGQRGLSLLEIFAIVFFLLVIGAIIIPQFFMKRRGGQKISRVKSDMRSLATAVEAYYVDNNEYPAMANGALGVNAKFSQGSGAYKICTFRLSNTAKGATLLHTLTTPVPYITSIFSDPHASTRGSVFGYRQFAYTWILISYGPDLDENALTPGDHNNTVCQVNLRSGPTGSYDRNFETSFVVTISQPSATYMSAIGNISGNALIYDPTNGTTSQGDVVRIKQ